MFVGIRLFIILTSSLISCQIFGQEFYPQESNLGITGGFGDHIFDGGGGISFVDFNGDGYDDLTFATELGEEIMFYENKGNTFELVDPPFVSNIEETKQIVWVDYDNDGDKDLFVGTFEASDKLYQNDGNMVFTDVTATVGLPTTDSDTHSANFADLDQDGWLELYIARYGEAIIGDTNSLYSYNSNTDYFDCVTSTSGTGNGFQESLATAFLDFDNDGDLDLYVSNDRLPMSNALYMNIGNLSFVDVSVPSQTNAFVFAMNAAVADYDEDGWMDIYITNVDNSILYKNNGDNTFTDMAGSANVYLDRFCWAGNFFDFDNDKDLDMYVCTSTEPHQDVPNAFLINDNGIYSEPYYASGGLGGNDWESSYSNAMGDLDNNGRVDFAVSKEMTYDFDVWTNHEDNANNFIKLDLTGADSHLDAYGTVVETWINGNKTITQKHCTVGYQSQHSEYLIIGLGTAATVDSLVIKWPFPNSVDLIPNSMILINGMNEVTENLGVTDSYFQNICFSGDHEVVLNPIPSQTYGSIFELSSSSEVIATSIVKFQSQKKVSLEIGFEVQVGAEFTAEINICGN